MFLYLLINILLLSCSLGTGKETEESNLLQQLSDACLVVDVLEPSVREELVKNFCSKELTSYRQIFEGAGQIGGYFLVAFVCLELLSVFIPLFFSLDFVLP